MQEGGKVGRDGPADGDRHGIFARIYDFQRRWKSLLTSMLGDERSDREGQGVRDCELGKRVSGDVTMRNGEEEDAQLRLPQLPFHILTIYDHLPHQSCLCTFVDKMFCPFRRQIEALADAAFMRICHWGSLRDIMRVVAWS